MGGTPSSNETKSTLTTLLKNANAEASTRPGGGIPQNEPYHLHVYAHKHNTQITFTDPGRNPILSYSCGNLGLKKAQRSSFDAAYQLSTYMMKKMAVHTWRLGGKKMTMNPLRRLLDIGSTPGSPGIEVIMRGFGPGREAFQKALLGSEGAMLRPKVTRVADATRLKFGGTRSPAVRRLG
jgi:small subunit ribosomal protein S11